MYLTAATCVPALTDCCLKLYYGKKKEYDVLIMNILFTLHLIERNLTDYHYHYNKVDHDDALQCKKTITLTNTYFIHQKTDFWNLHI